MTGWRGVSGEVIFRPHERAEENNGITHHRSPAVSRHPRRADESTNGDLAGLLLFGSFLVWAIADRISAGKRAALGPLGRRSGHLSGDLIAVVIGCVLYALMLKWGHQLIAGVPLLS
jgi:hypothetical protein